MATYKNHTVLSSVEENGDVNEIYPITDADDVNIKRNNSQVPSGVGNVQQLADRLGAGAFASTENSVYVGESDKELITSEIDDNTESKSSTWSSLKIQNFVNQNESTVREYVYSEAGKVTKFIPQHKIDENYVSQFLPATPQVYCVDASKFSTNSRPDGLTSKFIVEYFPYVDRDDIVDSPLNGPHRPNYAYQRWTKIQERAGESSAIYYRFFSNGIWDAFKKSSY